MPDDGSGSDDDCSMSCDSNSKYDQEEQAIIHSLCDSIENATKLSISPDIIVPTSGEWALYGNKMHSYLLSHGSCIEDTRYKHRFSAAAQTLEGHPKRGNLSIPGAQGQPELETIKKLDPQSIAKYLDDLTGVGVLKRK